MSVVSDSLKTREDQALGWVNLTVKPEEAQSEWNQWRVVHIVACIFSPLLITIPLIFHANQKMAEAEFQKQAALGLEAYRNKDWKKAIDHLEQLNDSSIKDVFKNKVYEILPNCLNEEDNIRLGTSIRSEAEKGISNSPGIVFYPSSAAISAIPLTIHKGEDNTAIVFGTLIGCAYLHQAYDELEKSCTVSQKLQAKAFAVISSQYFGCTRAKLNLVASDFEKIKQMLRRI